MWYKERCSTVGRCRTRLGAQRLVQCQTSICRESLVLSAQKDEGDQHTTSARQTCLRCLSTHNSQNLHLKTADRHASFMRICKCHLFRLLPHFSYISAKCTYCIFCRINWHFPRKFLIIPVFLLPISITSTTWFPTEWHQPCVWTSVERDGVVGFKQFCTIFPHIFAAYLVFMRHKNDMRKQIRATKVKCVAYKWLHTFLSSPGVNIRASILPLQT